jgi:hypothetical protein
MNRPCYLAALLVIAGILVLGPRLVAGPSGETGQRPPELHPGVIPIGSLGHPLGQYVTIEGVRAEGFKTGNRTLRVDTVSGQRVARPLTIWIDNLGLPEGGRCKIRGYETLRTLGVPPAEETAAAEAGKRISLPQAVWQIQLYFVALSVVSPRGLKPGSEGPTHIMSTWGDHNASYDDVTIMGGTARVVLGRDSVMITADGAAGVRSLMLPGSWRPVDAKAPIAGAHGMWKISYAGGKPLTVVLGRE